MHKKSWLWFVVKALLSLILVGLLVAGGFAIHYVSWSQGYAMGERAAEGEKVTEPLPYLYHGFRPTRSFGIVRPLMCMGGFLLCLIVGEHILNTCQFQIRYLKYENRKSCHQFLECEATVTVAREWQISIQRARAWEEIDDMRANFLIGGWAVKRIKGMGKDRFRRDREALAKEKAEAEGREYKSKLQLELEAAMKKREEKERLKVEKRRQKEERRKKA